jgi:RNA polymerase sigma-70 factor (ECF subfamily)
MPGREETGPVAHGAPDHPDGLSDQTALASRVYCVIPRDLAPALHDLLRRHFARHTPPVEVVVEQRAADRRTRDRRARPQADQTAQASGAAPTTHRHDDRRRVRALTGRRVSERRTTTLPVAAPPLPRRARAHAPRLAFIERLEPTRLHAEDADTARLVARIQAGDRDGFAALYLRYFDRVYSYLRLVLRDPAEAEDAAQQVFLTLLEVLPRYERREAPFRGWLFVIVRNHARAVLKRSARVELHPDLEPEQPDAAAPPDPDLPALGWIADRELLLFIERLPLAQRQVLALRYMLDLSYPEIAQVLDRTQDDVRSLHSRAVRFLRARLTAVGRSPVSPRHVPARSCPKHAWVLRHRRFALR